MEKGIYEQTSASLQVVNSIVQLGNNINLLTYIPLDVSRSTLGTTFFRIEIMGADAQCLMISFIDLSMSRSDARSGV